MVSKNSKVLIIESNEQLLNTLKEIFSTIYDIRTAISGMHALAIATEFKPDLIILDILLTGEMDGFSLLRHLKKDAAFHDVPVIVISASDQEELMQLSLEIGANDYLTKPFSFSILRHKINSMLNLRNSIKAKVVNTVYSSGALTYDCRDGFLVAQIERIIEDIITNDSKISIREMAKKINISLSTFERLMKRVYGLSPNRYIMKRKLERAHLLLSTNQHPIKNVAFMLGFNSVSYFTKCYKDAYGFSPRKTRVISSMTTEA
jgi:YesN/AraC family two-component response regulator